MKLEQPRRKGISLTLSADATAILKKLADTYEISQSRTVELILLQTGTKLLTQGKKAAKKEAAANEK